MQTVTARSFREASAEDWEMLVAEASVRYVEEAGDAFLQMLHAQRDNPAQGWMVNNYQHSLQCATRALRADEDEEFVITALFHDIAQDFYPYTHATMSAALLEPYLGAENHWIVANHQVFQLAFRTHSRFDTRACEKHRGHPSYERALYFCEHFDQNCFDPDYLHEPIETFEPIVKRHFAGVMRERIRAY